MPKITTSAGPLSAELLPNGILKRGDAPHAGEAAGPVRPRQRERPSAADSGSKLAALDTPHRVRPSARVRVAVESMTARK